MSFNDDPFHVLTLVKDIETGLYQWHCESCGAGYKSPARPAQTSVLMFEKDYQEHVRNSHALTPEDTKDWSVP
jgi:hypothetical protein